LLCGNHWQPYNDGQLDRTDKGLAMPDQPDGQKSTVKQVVPIIGMGGLIIILVLLALCALVLIILTLLEPTIGNVFSSVVPVQECSFSATVTVFEDVKADGVRDEKEPGVEGVPVTLIMDGKELVAAEDTDAEGSAEIYFMKPACEHMRQFTVIVEPPQGYEPTTDTAFGPYEVTFIGSAGDLTVGLQKSP
jgi:hypothetical protein